MDTIRDAAPQQKPAPIVVTLATVAKTVPPTLVVSTARDLMIVHQKNVQPSSWKKMSFLSKLQRTLHFRKPEPGLIKHPMHRSPQPVQIPQLTSDRLLHLIDLRLYFNHLLLQLLQRLLAKPTTCQCSHLSTSVASRSQHHSWSSRLVVFTTLAERRPVWRAFSDRSRDQ